MKHRINIIESAIKHKQIMLLIIGILMLAGIYSLVVMPRQEFPDFTIRQGVIVAAMPGASSEQMEREIAQPIENYLFGFKEVNKQKTTSQSKEGITYIFVEINDDVDEPRDFWAKIKHGLNVLKAKLPSDLYGIFVNDDFGNTSAMLISLESETKTYKELNEMMKGLESRLRQIESVSKLNRSGMQNEVINIYLQPEKMSYYGVKPLMIMMSFKTDGSLVYGGEVKNNVIEMPVHFSEKYQTAEDVAEHIILSDPTGAVVRVKDVAQVRREMKETESYISNNRTKCLLLSIEMLEGNNIVKFGGEVKKIIDDYSETLPQDVKITQIVNQAEIVQHSIVHFLKEFGIAILSVIIVTMLLLPLRVASVAGLTIPVSILITLSVMYAIGMQLDTVTLAALIAVLGMVVDNSIVIIDNYVEKLDHKVKPSVAAVDSVKELFIPVFTATMAILSCFTPLIFTLKGIGKDFLGSFPIAIAIALGASLIISALLVPYLCLKLIKHGLKKHDEENVKQRKSILDIMQSVYNATIDIAFKFPKITVTVGFVSIAVGLYLVSISQRELFPKMDRNQFAVEIYLPEGTPLNTTDSIVKCVENDLLSDKRVKNLTSFIGCSSPRFHTLYAPNMPAKNYAQMVVNTESDEMTLELLNDYSKSHTNKYPEAFVKFKQIDFNPNKAQIEVRISGDSISQIKAVAGEIESMFRKIPHVVWVRNDYLEAKQALKFDLNNIEMTRLGLTKFDLMTSFMIAQKGLPVTTIWEDDNPVNIQLCKQKDKLDKDFELSDMYLPTLLTSNYLPLRTIAVPKPEWTEGQIVRRNGVRTLSVQVDVERGIIPSDILKIGMNEIEKMKLPKGISISYGSEHENEGEQYPRLSSALAIGIILVFFILLFQFKSIRSSLLIMFTIPLSLLGASVGLLVMGYPFGFTSFFGIISLSGLVVRNGIILLDYADSLIRDAGMRVKEAAIAAGKRRLRPIFLTSSAAAVGLLPMMLSGSTLWGPFASVISFGLIFSMALTLLVLPVLYWYLFRSRDKHPVNAEIEETAI